MKILDRYIGRQILYMVSIVALALLGIDLFFYFVNEIKYIGKGNYTLGTAILFIILTIPRKLYIMIPWSALVGTLLALGTLAGNSELVAMRTASVSVKRIAIAALKAGLIIAIAIFLLGEFVAPASEKLSKTKKTLALSSGQAVQTQYGTWVRNDEEYIHIRGMVSPTKLRGITRYRLDADGKLIASSFAKSAEFKNGVWELHNIKETRFFNDSTRNLNIKQAYLNELVDHEIIEASGVKHLERLSLKSLYKTIKSRDVNNLNTQPYEVAFWTKIFHPISILVMIFLSIPFVFGPLRQSSMGFKILIGVVTGFVFYFLNSISASLTEVYPIPAFISKLAPVLLFFIIGSFFIKRVR